MVISEFPIIQKRHAWFYAFCVSLDVFTKSLKAARQLLLQANLLWCSKMAKALLFIAVSVISHKYWSLLFLKSTKILPILAKENGRTHLSERMLHAFVWILCLSDGPIFVTGTQGFAYYSLPYGTWYCQRLEWYGKNMAVYLLKRSVTDIFRGGVKEYLIFEIE